ncbi:hypothetical protein JW756_02135 [Candidatus Woesearchaeota archaeon]|nr:hypothetical protein [Candidatus Woesearchaeota archaeon]
METKYKLKHFLDEESIEFVLKDKDEKKAMTEEFMEKMQKHSSSEHDVVPGSAEDKLGAKYSMVLLFEIAASALKENDPDYYEKFMQEVKQKKGEADVDVDYLEKKMPLLGTINSALGIYESRNSAKDLSSFIKPKADAEELEKIIRGKKKIILAGESAKELGKYVISTYVLPIIMPELKEHYAHAKKLLNLPKP